MKFYSLPFSLILAAAITSAFKVNFKQVKQRPTLQPRGEGPSDLQLAVNAAVDDNGLDLKCVARPFAS